MNTTQAPDLRWAAEQTQKGLQPMTYYGPHSCETCGQTIVKQAREEGGAAFDPPPMLMRVFLRGAEAGNPDVTYPMMWTPHVCVKVPTMLPPPPAVTPKE